uniref:PH domain-containing protein n=2 Tax=Caenorhabditis tropicalis TaxID=1561998 RepID=A0A1I7UND6_9PELO
MLIYQKKPIAQKFNKMVPLPDATAWKVDPTVTLIRARVLCMFRTKRTFLPDDISSLKMRLTTVTKNGDMIFYETRNQGIVVNLREATDVLTECDKYKNKKMKYSRSHVKIRMPQGNIHIFVRDEAIFQWTSAILEAHVSCRPKKPFVIIRREPFLTKPINAIEQSDSPNSSSSNSGLITVIERQPVVSEDTLVPSVRCGAVPVGTLCHKIEKEWSAQRLDSIPSKPKHSEAIEEKKISSFIVCHNGGIRTNAIKPIVIKTEKLDDEEKKIILKLEKPEEKSDVASMKDWWMRSLEC